MKERKCCECASVVPGDTVSQEAISRHRLCDDLLLERRYSLGGRVAMTLALVVAKRWIQTLLYVHQTR